MGSPTEPFPPGHVIDWHKPSVTSSLNAETGEVVLLGGLVEGVVGLDTLTVSLEVLPPTEATTVPTEATTASPSAQWAIAATRTLRAEGKIPEAAMKQKSELARLLEAEGEKAVKVGKLARAA